MTATDDLKTKTDRLRKVVEDEKKALHLDSVNAPSLVEKVLSYDYSNLDSLGMRDLEKHLGTLSQYLIYMHKYLNQVMVAKVCAEDEYERSLTVAILAVEKGKYKSIKEKTMEAEQDPAVRELKDHVDIFNARLAVHKNMPDSIENLIQTIKKTYDAKIRERFVPNE